MFKKLKDKLAEEMKQSPARLQAGMQQLAQAVSPAVSNSSILDISSIKDNFSLTDDLDETPKNSPLKHGFQTIDLTSPSENSILSRRSSVSSSISDVSSLFPIYETSPNNYMLQSDLDQSASEMDDSSNVQLDKISKEQLYSAYRKVQGKYHKYKGRFSDLVTHYQDIEKTKTKLESLLVETQDKALRRISDLKEQCLLEQQAKAHLEEALRNDIEEKDHVINSLKTKIQLLQNKNLNSDISNSTENENSNEQQSNESFIDLSDITDSEKSFNNSKLNLEIVDLNEKLQKLESFSEKYKEMLKQSKEKMLEITNDKDTIQRDYNNLKKSSEEKIMDLQGKLNSEIQQSTLLKEQLDLLKKREEESSISLAENKLSIHRELEEKEVQLKKLRSDLKQAHDLEKILSNTISTQKQEMESIKTALAKNLKTNQIDAEENSKEFIKAQRNIQEKLIKFNKITNSNFEKMAKKSKNLDNLLDSYKEKIKKLHQQLNHLNQNKSKLIEKENTIQELLKNNKLLKENSESQESEINTLKNEILELKNLESNSTKQLLKYENELKDLNNILMDKNEICNKSNLKIEEYKVAFDKFKQKLIMQTEEIKNLKSKPNDNENLIEFQEKLDNKSTEILGLTSELKSCETTIKDLKSKSTMLEKINKTIINNFELNKIECNNLKSECLLLKNEINTLIESGKSAIIKIIIDLTTENSLLQNNIKEINEKTKLLNSVTNEKLNIEKKLKEQINESEVLKEKIINLEIKNSNLVSEINILKSEISSEKIINSQINLDLERLKNDIVIEKEQHDNLISELSAKQKEEISYMKSVLNENNKTDQTNNAEILNLKKELELTKKESYENSNELKKLTLQYDNEMKHLSKLNTKCENYKKLLKENNNKILELKSELKICKEKNEFYLKIMLNFKKDAKKQTINLKEKIINMNETFKNDFNQFESVVTLFNDEIIKLKNSENELLNVNKESKERLNLLKAKNCNLEEEINKYQKIVEESKNNNIEITNLLEQKQIYEEENKELLKCNKNLESVNESLKLEIDNLKNYESKNNFLESEIDSTKKEIEVLTNKLIEKDDEIFAIKNNFEKENNHSKIEFEKQNVELESLKTKYSDLLEKFDKLKNNINMEENLNIEIEKLNVTKLDLEKKLSQKELELKDLHEKHKTIQEELQLISKNISNNEELLKRVNDINSEKQKLESQLDETLVTFQSKESQMKSVNEDLKNQVNKLQKQLTINEDEQNLRLKQIVKEFQAQLQDKEKELQASLNKRFDQQQNYETDLIKEYKEQLKDFQVEITKKSQEIEKLEKENTNLNFEIEKHSSEINQLKTVHEKELIEMDKKWKDSVKEKANLEIEHRQEISKLSNDWQNEKNNGEHFESASEDMINPQKILENATQSNSGSFHTLQQTLLSQKRELCELRKLVDIRHDSLEDSTELEYLRNILYKYMMGKETLVLARVIAAVVKFDQEQTSKILKKEEDKLSLLGSLGLL